MKNVLLKRVLRREGSLKCLDARLKRKSPTVVRSKWVFQEFLFVAKVAIIHREIQKKWQIIHPQEDFVKSGYKPDMKCQNSN
jgi:hypothetical protein